MGAIHRLPEDVSGRIAAGEVIEGPFSVVRELLDNSLDAGAGEISVGIRGGGREEIRVSDDGSGMSEEDALLSLQKHTTSKIRNLEDLASISTMGFRGEALASVCAVSELAMLTKRAGDERGTRVTVRFGGESASAPAAANKGTDITVRELFLNLPARRKFLKSDRAESARVGEEVRKKALSFHGTGFALRYDERLVFRLLPRSSPLGRIGELYGPGLEKNLVPFALREERFSLGGFVSNRLHTLSNRSGQYVFVNGRPVEDRNLLFAVNAPTRGIVPAGRYPHAFVFIEIDPALLDVNVHPAKREIRFRIEIAGALATAVRRALEERFYPAGWADLPASSPVGGPGGPAVWGEGSAGHGARAGDAAGGNHGSPAFSGAGEPYSPGPGAVREATAGAGSFRPLAAQPLLYQGSLPSSEELSFKGTLFGTFCLFEGSNSILLLDQHAAHERVLYERFSGRGGGGRVVKALLVPINITPPRALYAELLENLDELGDAGFEVEPFGDDSVNVRAVPGFIPDDLEEQAVSLLMEELGSGRPAFRGAEIRDRFLRLAACRGAVKEGDSLGREEAFRLLDDLRGAKVPFVCPHGRPTCFLVARESIERAFHRR